MFIWSAKIWSKIIWRLKYLKSFCRGWKHEKSIICPMRKSRWRGNWEWSQKVWINWQIANSNHGSYYWRPSLKSVITNASKNRARIMSPALNLVCPKRKRTVTVQKSQQYNFILWKYAGIFNLGSSWVLNKLSVFWNIMEVKMQKNGSWFIIYFVSKYSLKICCVCWLSYFRRRNIPRSDVSAFVNDIFKHIFIL